MKTKITMTLLFATSIGAFAQKTEQRMLQLSGLALEAKKGNTTSNFGLTYLVNKKNGWTNRYGFSITNYNTNLNAISYSNYPNNVNLLKANINVMRFNAGKEYRLPITTQIYLVGGADAYLQYQYGQGFQISSMWDSTLQMYQSNKYELGFEKIFNFGIKPFAGIRANFGRVNLGLEASSALDFKAVNSGYQPFNLSTTPIQAKFTIGYRMSK